MLTPPASPSSSQAAHRLRVRPSPCRVRVVTGEEFEHIIEDALRSGKPLT
jgi:hypothetical protein